MKKLLLGAVALGAIAATPAAAQPDQIHYARPNIGATGTVTAPYNFVDGLIIVGNELALANGIGTRYTTEANAPADSTAATRTVNVEFTLTGSVNKDCSFYSGNTAGARNIDFGVIGVRTGNNENVNNAFQMVGAAEAEIQTLTAGCNFNNAVEINKDDVRGMVNVDGSGYDTNEFQANIPYSVTARWNGVGVSTIAAGSNQELEVGLAQNSATKLQGAWRSAMTIDINAPVIQDKGLVAGTYTGKTTLTLRAL